MADISLVGMSAETLIRVGDALLSAGENRAAIHAYTAAIEGCPSDKRSSLSARLGFVRYGPPGCVSLLGIQRAIENIFPDQDAWVSSHLAVWGKTNSFTEDSRLMSILSKHARLLHLPNWQWNIQAPLWALAQVAELPGDFVELGVFKGHTTICLAEYYDFQNSPRSWFLYDTFDGIPDDQLNTGWGGINLASYKGTFSVEEVSARFAAFPNIEVIKGRVPEILHERCPEKIAFLHMDLNSAIAEVAALDFLFDRIVPGGVIVFDDYGWSTAIEQHRAEKAWFKQRGLVVLELPTGQGVFVKR